MHYDLLKGRMAAIVIGLFFIVSSLAVTACGGSEDTGDGVSTGGSSTEQAQANTVAQPTINVSRPQPGTIEVSDAASDAVSNAGIDISIASWIDISKASISRQGENYQFSLELAGALPQSKPETLLGVEWGFLLDTSGDGQPNLVVYASLQGDQYSPGIFNQDTKERLADAQFPGTYLFEGSTLTWTFPATAIGSPNLFNWIAYVDAGADAGASGTFKMGDTVPDNAWPKGTGWLSFP